MSATELPKVNIEELLNEAVGFIATESLCSVTEIRMSQSFHDELAKQLLPKERLPLLSGASRGPLRLTEFVSIHAVSAIPLIVDDENVEDGVALLIVPDEEYSGLHWWANMRTGEFGREGGS
jgi:hypothetical protein